MQCPSASWVWTSVNSKICAQNSRRKFGGKQNVLQGGMSAAHRCSSIPSCSYSPNHSRVLSHRGCRLRSWAAGPRVSEAASENGPDASQLRSVSFPTAKPGRFSEANTEFAQDFVVRGYEVGPNQRASINTIANLLQVRPSNGVHGPPPPPKRLPQNQTTPSHRLSSRSQTIELHHACMRAGSRRESCRRYMGQVRAHHAGIDRQGMLLLGGRACSSVKQFAMNCNSGRADPRLSILITLLLHLLLLLPLHHSDPRLGLAISLARRTSSSS